MVNPINNSPKKSCLDAHSAQVAKEKLFNISYRCLNLFSSYHDRISIQNKLQTLDFKSLSVINNRDIDIADSNILEEFSLIFEKLAKRKAYSEWNFLKNMLPKERSQLEKVIQEICCYSLVKNRLSSLRLCQYLLFDEATGEDRERLKKTISRLILFIPKPLSPQEKISQSLYKTSLVACWNFRKKLHYLILVFQLAYLTLNATTFPKNPEAAREYLSWWYQQCEFSIKNAQTFFSWILLALNFPQQWIEKKIVLSPMKASLLKLLTFCSLVGLVLQLYKMYYEYGFSQIIPDLNNRSIINLNEEVAKEQTDYTYLRHKELQMLISTLSLSPQGKPLYPILLADAGTGKTSLFKGLAQMINQGQAPSLKGKTVLYFNTAQMLDTMGDFFEGEGYLSAIDVIFKKLKNYGNNVILIFDEAHMISQKRQSFVGEEAPLIEKLKTNLEKFGINCAFATTTQEYESQIKPNQAFDSRLTKIVLSPLSTEQIHFFLRKELEKQGNNLGSFSDDIIKGIVQWANLHYHREFSPRRELLALQFVLNSFFSWNPKKLSQEKEILLIKKQKLSAKCQDLFNQDHLWVQKEDSSSITDSLEKINTEIANLETKISEQNELYHRIFDMKTLFKFYEKQRDHLLYELKDYYDNKQTPGLNPRRIQYSSEEKDFLFLYYFILPQLQYAIESLSLSFEEKFQESIPHELSINYLNQFLHNHS